MYCPLIWDYDTNNPSEAYTTMVKAVDILLLQSSPRESQRVIKVWFFHRPTIWWKNVLQKGWCSHLSFRAKVFNWRIMVGTWCITIASGFYFFCTVEVEHSRHRFISCPVTKMVWKFINAIWMSFTGVIKSPFKWVFAQVEIGLSPFLQIILVYLAYAKCFYIWWTKWSTPLCAEIERGPFMAIVIVGEVKHIQSWRETSM